MSNRVYVKSNILIVEITSVEPGFTEYIRLKILEQLHFLKRPFCLILDYQTLDAANQVIPHSEYAGFIGIIELLDRTGRTHAIWIHGPDSKNTDILAQLITRHSIAYTKAKRAHNMSEAQKMALKLLKDH